MRRGPQSERVDLVGALPVDPGLDQVLGEHVALGEVVVVGLERVEDEVEAARSASLEKPVLVYNMYEDDVPPDDDGYDEYSSTIYKWVVPWEETSRTIRWVFEDSPVGKVPEGWTIAKYLLTHEREMISGGAGGFDPDHLAGYGFAALCALWRFAQGKTFLNGRTTTEAYTPACW